MMLETMAFSEESPALLCHFFFWKGILCRFYVIFWVFGRVECYWFFVPSNCFWLRRLLEACSHIFFLTKFWLVHSWEGVWRLLLAPRAYYFFCNVNQTCCFSHLGWKKNSWVFFSIIKIWLEVWLLWFFTAFDGVMIIRYVYNLYFSPVPDTCDCSMGAVALSFVQFSFHTWQYFLFELSVFVF